MTTEWEEEFAERFQETVFGGLLQHHDIPKYIDVIDFIKSLLTERTKEVIEDFDNYSEMPLSVKASSNPEVFMNWKKQQLKEKYGLQ